MSARDDKDRVDEYTVKLPREHLLRAAREADARVRAGESAAVRPTNPQDATDAEIDVAIEPLEDDVEVDALLLRSEPHVPPSKRQDDQSAIRRTWRDEDGPRLSSVPHLAVDAEDLPWLATDGMWDAVLEMVDAKSTVGSIVERLTMPREQALGILRELGSRGIVGFR